MQPTEWRILENLVMSGLVPGIHVLARKKDVDGRDEPGHEKATIGHTIKISSNCLTLASFSIAWA
jgi:hypothetical protein